MPLFRLPLTRSTNIQQSCCIPITRSINVQQSFRYHSQEVHVSTYTDFINDTSKESLLIAHVKTLHSG